MTLTATRTPDPPPPGPQPTAPPSHPPARPCAAPSTGPSTPSSSAGATRSSADDVVRDTALTVDEARDWTLDRVVDARRRATSSTAGFPIAQGGTGTAAESVANFEMVAMGDLSLTIKSGVQHGLFGGAITNLGTHVPPRDVPARRHHHRAARLLRHDGAGPRLRRAVHRDHHHLAARDGRVRGPFAHPDRPRRPTSATRPGTARMAAVFGQLMVDGEHQGVHVVLVPIRDEAGTRPARASPPATTATRAACSASTTAPSPSTTSACRG